MRLREKISKEISPKMAAQLKRPVLALPRLSKVVVSVGVGPFRERKEVLEAISKELQEITSQKPKTNIAKKSISGFKLREGQTIGYQVTLRGKRMWDFVERLIKVVLPRLRDFDGVSIKSIDKSGNLSIAIREQIIFPEIKADEIKENWGLGVTFVLNNPYEATEAKDYYSHLGIIFK